MDNCNIVRDLLPLYVEELTSEESVQAIQVHLTHCVECQAHLERMKKKVSVAQTTENADYKKALQVQRRKITTKHLLIACIALFLGIAIFAFVLWSNGYFNILTRQTSPDGTITVTVYSGDTSGIFPTGSGFTIKETGVRNGILYYDTAFRGMWWSANSQYLLIPLETEQGLRLELIDYQRSSVQNLVAYLTMAINTNEAFSGVPRDDKYANPIIEYDFVQWSEHDSTLLLHFAYQADNASKHTGYFWYDCETGKISGIWEIPA